MTTTTHSHKAWTDEGGHVSITHHEGPLLRGAPSRELP
jgi:hypothetical protein